MNPSLKAWLHSHWRALRYGFLFLPGVIATAFAGLALVLVRVDRLGEAHGLGVGFGGDAAAARSVLSSIASSLITLAGLTFTITIVSLQLVSQQFTPRALRNFLGDRLNQIVAGCFVGIFAYCLLVLRAVRDASAASRVFDGFVPGLSVTLAIVLGILTLALLLVFIHHMSRSIQVSTIAATVGSATLDRVEKLYPNFFGDPVEEDGNAVVSSWSAGAEPVVVTPPRPGFVQTLDLDGLGEREAHRGWKLHVRAVPGDFVTPATAIAEVWAPDPTVDLVAEVRALVAVEDECDLAQDALYGVRQLTDIAVRALSPSTNDPTTAITCLGYIQAVLERLAGRALPREVRELDSVKVVARRRSFEDFVDVGLAQVADHAASDRRVAAAVLAAADSVAQAARAAGATERVNAIERAVEEIGPGSATARVRRTNAPEASAAPPR